MNCKFNADFDLRLQLDFKYNIPLATVCQNFSFDSDFKKKEIQMTRQSVTLSRRFLELAGELNDKDRLTCYDKILNHLFNEIPIKTQGESDALRITLACLGPELRKAQTQYENGIISKKLSTNTKGFLCHFDGSQQQANSKPEKSPNDYNIYNNKNILYTNNQSNHQHDKTQDVSFDAITNGNVEMYAHALEKILKQIQTINAMVSLRTAETLSKIVKSESIKIKKEEYAPAQVLKQIYETIRQIEPGGLAELLQELFNDIDARKVTNKTKYEIMSLFHIHTRVKTNKKTQKKKESFQQHNYTPEQLNSVYTDLDKVEI